MSRFLTKKINNNFCKYELKDISYKDMFYDPYYPLDFDIETDVPATLTLAVDLAGDCERLLKKYKFNSIEELDTYLKTRKVL